VSGVLVWLQVAASQGSSWRSHAQQLHTCRWSRPPAAGQHTCWCDRTPSSSSVRNIPSWRSHAQQLQTCRWSLPLVARQHMCWFGRKGRSVCKVYAQLASSRTATCTHAGGASCLWLGSICVGLAVHQAVAASARCDPLLGTAWPHFDAARNAVLNHFQLAQPRTAAANLQVELTTSSWAACCCGRYTEQ
jgi:hypothetical protein